MKLRVGTITRNIQGISGRISYDLCDCIPISNISEKEYIELLTNRLICTPVCCPVDDIEKVIYHDPATIVKWKDGTKSVVKCQKDKGDTYNPEQGLAMCIVKKICGNKGNYNDIFTKWLPKENNNEETI